MSTTAQKIIDSHNGAGPSASEDSSSQVVINGVNTVSPVFKAAILSGAILEPSLQEIMESIQTFKRILQEEVSLRRINISDQQVNILNAVIIRICTDYYQEHTKAIEIESIRNEVSKIITSSELTISITSGTQDISSQSLSVINVFTNGVEIACALYRHYPEDHTKVKSLLEKCFMAIYSLKSTAIKGFVSKNTSGLNDMDTIKDCITGQLSGFLLGFIESAEKQNKLFDEKDIDSFKAAAKSLIATLHCMYTG